MFVDRVDGVWYGDGKIIKQKVKDGDTVAGRVNDMVFYRWMEEEIWSMMHRCLRA